MNQIKNQKHIKEKRDDHEKYLYITYLLFFWFSLLQSLPISISSYDQISVSQSTMSSYHLMSLFAIYTTTRTRRRS